MTCTEQLIPAGIQAQAKTQNLSAIHESPQAHNRSVGIIIYYGGNVCKDELYNTGVSLESPHYHW